MSTPRTRGRSRRSATGLAGRERGDVDGADPTRQRRRHMTTTNARTGLQLRSTVKKEGIVEISLASVPTPEPKPEEVIVRIDASPINPSDQGLLFGGADMSTAKASGTTANPVVTASISPAVLKALAGRWEQSLPVGNEGAGVVVQAGAAPAAQALMGETRAIPRGGGYAQDPCLQAVPR